MNDRAIANAAVEADDLCALRAWLDEHRDLEPSSLQSLLTLAVAHERVACAEAILDRVADIEQLDSDGFVFSLIHQAASVDDERLLELLLLRGARLDHQNCFYLYQIAASNVNEKVIAAIVHARAPVDFEIDRGVAHPVLCAARLCNEAVLMCLIDDAGVKVPDLQEALEVAARNNDNAKPFRFLVDRFGCGQFDERVCFAAAENVNASVMRRLLAEGVDPNIRRQSDSATLCHVAAAHGRLETLRFLLAAGADFDVLDRAGRSPCSLAVKQGHRDVVEELLRSGAKQLDAVDAIEHADVFEMFIAAGADWRSRFGLACDFCLFDIVDDRIVDFVLAADVRCEQQHHQAQVELAVQLGRIDALRRLRRGGAAAVDHNRLVLVAAMCDAASVSQDARYRTGVTWSANCRARRASKAQLLGELFAVGVQFESRDIGWLSYICADSAYQREALATVIAAGMDLTVVGMLVAVRAVGVPLLAAVGARPLPIAKSFGESAIDNALRQIAKCQLALLRRRGFEVCVGLQALDMSALQLCEILSCAFAPLESMVPFHNVWKVVTTVKHFRQ